MKKYLNQIILIPVIVLYYLIGVFIFNRLTLSIDYYIYGLYVASAFIIQFLNSRYKDNKIARFIRIFIILFVLIILYFRTYYEPLKILFNASTYSINDINVIPIFSNSLYLFIFSVICASYKSVIENKKINIFASTIISFCLLSTLIQKRIDLLTIIMIIISLLLIVFNGLYNNINLLDYQKSTVIILLFICCAIFSYLLIPYVENISIRDGINNVKDSTSALYDDLFNSSTLSLDGIFFDIKLSPTKKELSNDTVLTVDSSYLIDRVKAYSCSKFDINTNSFIIENKIKIDKQNDFKELFIESSSKDLSEYFHVVRNKIIDNVAYVPYGKLSFDDKVNIYDDLFIQFKNKDNYNEYTLTFNPFNNTSVINVDLLSKYTNYVNNNSKEVPDQILKSIKKFIDEDKDLYNLQSEDSINKKEFINRINNYLNEKFIIKDEYVRNNEGINDVSYALEKEHIANKQLLAVIKMFMYRYEDIPSRYVVGYLVKDYDEKSIYIHEDDKSYWTEVFIDGKWIPAEEEYLNASLISNLDLKIIKSEGMDGNIDETFEQFSNTKTENVETVLKVETNYEVDKIKQSSFGDYNPINQEFEYDEDISNYPSIKTINRLYDLDDYFKNQFLFDEDFKYYMKITSFIDNNAYVPYGQINIQDVSMYQDKAVLLNNAKASYLINFEPYSNDNLYKVNSLYEDYVYEKYLNVPDSMRGELEDFLVSKGIDYNSKDKALLIRQIKNLLQGKDYTYTLTPGSVLNGKDVLLYFLKENKKGFCQHFAGVATLLYRVCGIPSRYTVGFAIKEYEDGIAELTALDAHAWCEVFTKNYGWKPIEVTKSRRSTIDDFEIKYVESDKDDSESINTDTSNVHSIYNIQPDLALDKQVLDDDKTYINANVVFEDNKILAIIESDKEINRLKAYSLGNYNVDNEKFFLGEDISNKKEILKLKQLYELDDFFKNVFISDTSFDNKINVKLYDSNKWVYVPYGMINISDANLYQDKYLYFNDELKYDNYSLSYSLDEIDEESNINSDYETFVYNYYTQVPHDFEILLNDYLDGKKIDINSFDKVSIIKRIQDIFINNYIYDDNYRKPKDIEIDETLTFILRSRQGDDEMYAYGATLLLRMCNIPARVVSGYYLDNYKDGKYEVTSNNIHSWVEVYTSNYGWMPVEVCPKYKAEEVDNYKFRKQYIIEEDDALFVDIEKKHNSRIYLYIGGVSIIVIIGFIVVYKIKKMKEEYIKKLESLGIKTKEQLMLLRSINKNYLLLKNNGYANKEIEEIMLRIRFSKRKENKDDLKVILDRVEFMKKDIRKRKTKHENIVH